MAFYPDELSPIDLLRSLGKQTEKADIGQLKNRRHWKSLVLGKKDVGMNNFATITEEKEDEMSSDGSQGANKKGSSGGLSAGVVTNKNITFPKPRKYITSRVSDKKEEESLRSISSPDSFASLSSIKESPNFCAEAKKSEISNISSFSKTNLMNSITKPKEFASPQTVINNYVLTETPIESQWNGALFQSGLGSWSKSSVEKINLSKNDLANGPKPKSGEKRKTHESSKISVIVEPPKRDKGNKKKTSVSKKASNAKNDLPSTSTAGRVEIIKEKYVGEKGKTLNMKEVVNVYKNLAYGSKEEIKTFVENLSLVKDPSKIENDKNLLSMMNLKALENKIRNFTKKTEKTQEVSTSKEKKPKVEKPIKKNRKAHIDRLARHKVVRVPAVLNNYYKKTEEIQKSVKQTGQTSKDSVNKEPWKYVGMESVLDKSYFVYPAYPPSVSLKNTNKSKKVITKNSEKTTKGKSEATSFKTSESEPKVKSQPSVLRSTLFSGGTTRQHGLSVSGSTKNVNRPSATTVCTVEFRPGQKLEEQIAATDPSLLVYLHGTKALNVKFPYCDKQFSRVKLFRKDERGTPLIKGISRAAFPKTVSVRNISLPEKLTRVRSIDLLDFDEDIQNITEFLRSQEIADQSEDKRGLKKNDRDWGRRESPRELNNDALFALRHRRQRRPAQNLSSYTNEEILSPDSIINEISKNVQHLQYLPDTEENRKMIAEFFDELDHQIEATRKGSLGYKKFTNPEPETFRPIPILGY